MTKELLGVLGFICAASAASLTPAIDAGASVCSVDDNQVTISGNQTVNKGNTYYAH